MEGKRRDAEDMLDSLMVEEGIMVKFPLGTFCHFCSSCFKVICDMKKLNNHIVEIHKVTTS